MPSTANDVDWAGLVRPLVAGRRVILAGAPVVALTDTVGWLRRLGSDRVLIIGSGIGTGDLPDAADADWVVLETRAPDPVTEFRTTERLLTDPPLEVRDAIGAHDPGRDALLLVAPYQVVREVHGRRASGARRPEWVALEDKTLADALFDAAGVDRPDSEVVAAEPAALHGAAARLDRGAGTVWAGDAREGFNGGGVFVRWIQPGDDDAAAEAVSFFAGRCDRVRVAPFLEGIPCSIHGIVVDDGVAVFRPAEMVTLRDGPRFRYAGVATYWDPDPADREAMRVAARRVGELLSDRAGFRGCFGIDGVMTAGGFLPTELNPRFGGGMATIGRGLADRVPLVLLHHALIEDPTLVPASVLEDRLTAAADGCRAGGGWLLVDRRRDTTERHGLVLDEAGWRLARPDDSTDAELSMGPGASGGFVRVVLDPQRTPLGPPVGERVASALAFADAAFDTGTGALTAAPDVRPPRR